MAALPVPTIPVRMNNFSVTLSTATYRGVTMDGLHMCWTTANSDMVIQRIAYDNNAGTFILKGGSQDYLGTSISNFQAPLGRANIFVKGNQVWTMRRNSGQVFLWEKLNGRIQRYYPGIVGNFDANIVGETQTYFAQNSVLRIDPFSKSRVIRSYWYDNTSWCASVVINRRNRPINTLLYDYSLDNGNPLDRIMNRIPLTAFGSNSSYGLNFSGSNTLIVDYVYGSNVMTGLLNNDVDPGTVPIRGEDKARNLSTGSDAGTGYIQSMPYSFRNGINEITPLVQCVSTGSGRNFSLVDFNNKYFKLVNDDGTDYCYTRQVPVNLLIPKSFIDPFSNTVITPSLGTFTMRMYTDGNTFGTIASVDGLQFLFLAAFPANKSAPINNYSLGIGAKKP